MGKVSKIRKSDKSVFARYEFEFFQGETLVYTGEHYVVDCVLGWIYAVAVFLAVRWWFDRRQSLA